MNNPSELYQVKHIGEYDSEFESDTEASKKRKRHYEEKEKDKLFVGSQQKAARPKRTDFGEECSKEQGRIRRFQFLALDAYTRHKEIINHYFLCYRGSTARLRRNTANDKTDIDIIKENHKFLWEDDEEANTWGKQLAKKYYDKLFKEYCVADLSRYKENKIALRWRTEAEVIKGIGQFSCGHLKCNAKDELTSWEVNFGYVEQGEKKNALVKLRLCITCSYKLNFCHKRKKASTVKEKSDMHDTTSDTNVELKESKTNVLSASSSEGSSGNSGDIDKSVTDTSIWKAPAPQDNDSTLSRADEFEQYLSELLL